MVFPNVSIGILCDISAISLASAPVSIQKKLRIVGHQNTLFHFPVVYVNDLWRVDGDELVPLLSSAVVYVTIDFVPLWKYSLASSFADALENQRSLYGSEVDGLKRMIGTTSPYLLLLTLIVSILHMVFEFLAFKNDIQYWRGRKDAGRGISKTFLLLSFFSETVILLYLVDEGTSMLVLSQYAVSLAITMWKLWVTRRQKILSVSSIEASADALAFKYLGWLVFPLLLGYSSYAYCQDQQSITSYYSFGLKTLVGFVYAFGFIMMTPQLFINYKLKSVAHLPWRVFVYKALNTFIDDLFAFVIKMPTLHRLACLRDDIIFVIYLYQRYLYPTDTKREVDSGPEAVNSTMETD